MRNNGIEGECRLRLKKLNMITKEKLEELIKKKAKVYDAVSKDEINLSNICHIFPIISGKCIMDYKLLVIDGRGCVSSYLLSWLKEDVETAGEQSTDNWAECPNCKEKDKEIKICKERIEELAEQRENLHKEKDHRIAVLEKALNILIDELLEEGEFPCCFCYKQSNCNLKCSGLDTNEAIMYLIEETEKELEEKE